MRRRKERRGSGARVGKRGSKDVWETGLTFSEFVDVAGHDLLHDVRSGLMSQDEGNDGDGR